MTETNVAAEPGGAAPSSAPAPAPNGADHGGEDKTYTVTDTRSAGDAIAGLLYGGDEPESGGEARESAAEPPDTGADERPTGDEDGTSESEQPAKPAAIEAPVSWTADEKQAFSQLPPALQQTIVRRESQREAALTQRSQEAAEVRRAYDGERQAAVAQRAEYLSGLQKMLALAAPEAQALANIDWVAVQAQSPAEYTRLHALREDLRGRLGAIEQQFQHGQAQLAAYHEQQKEQQLAELVAHERRTLHEKVPDFADQAKGPQLRNELSAYLRESGGFTPDELNKAYDHRLVILAQKAMLYDRGRAAAASADTKRNNVAPQVRAPGNSQDNDRGPHSRLQSRVNRLGRTNNVRDAGSLIAELL